MLHANFMPLISIGGKYERDKKMPCFQSLLRVVFVFFFLKKKENVYTNIYLNIKCTLRRKKALCLPLLKYVR